MRIGLIVAISTLLTASLGKSQVSLLEFGSHLSVEHIGSDYAFSPYVTYGLSVALIVTEGTKVGISASFANPHKEYDLIGASGREEIDLHRFEAFLSYKIGRALGAVDFAAVGNIGFTVLSSEERTISAGAFGTVKVPGRTERSASYSAGFTASRELFPRFSVFVTPKLLLNSPVQFSSIGYSIEGGLSLGIL